MPRRPLTPDGIEVPTFEEFSASTGTLDPEQWTNPTQLAYLRAHAKAWHDMAMAELDRCQSRGGTLLASERRTVERALDNVDAFADLLESAGASVAYRKDSYMPDLLTQPDGVETRAFRGYLRTGDESELRAQGVASGASGGYLVPQGFRAKVIETMKATGGVRSVAEIITTDSGNDLPFPTNDDTSNVGAILAENTQVSEQDFTLGTKTLRAYAYTSKLVRVSLQLLQDAGFDLDSWLARNLGVRVARAQNAHFTTGTGSSQPEGVVTNATVGKTGASGQTTTVIYDDLVDLVHSVDPAYREGEGVAWMMNDATFAAVRKLKDSQNRPLVEPDVKAGLPNTILGYPVVVNQDMANMGVSVKSILFGNFRAYYVIRDVSDFSVLRLVERYADYLQTGFLGWQRSDGIVQDASAVKAYRNAAS